MDTARRRDLLKNHDIRDAASALGLTLRDEDLAAFGSAVAEQLEEFDEFLSAEIDDSPPPVHYRERRSGHRPTPEEDPYRAWLWKCEIRGSGTGCLAGKTVSFKDHIAVAGVPLTFGCRALEQFVPDFDATVVERILDAGGTIVGKNMLNGFTGLGGPAGESDFGRPLNPRAPEHVTGGSSSGSAAAVAGGEVDVSIAGDQGGSIRVPSAWCGVVGLKPTFGLVSHFGAGFGYDLSLDTVGPMARRVEDVARAVQAIAGYDPLDPRQRRDVPDAIDALSSLHDGLTGVRIGILEEGFEGADPRVAKIVLDVVGEAERVSVPQHALAQMAWRALVPEGARAILQTTFFGAFGRTHYPAEVLAEICRVWRTESRRLVPRTITWYLAGELGRRAYDGRVYAKAHNVRPAIVRAYNSALERVDLLAMPTTPITAPRYAPADAQSLATGHHVTRNTGPFNYTGHPALAVPCGELDGLPVSMQLVGRFYDDPLLLRVAQAYETAGAG